MFQQGTFDAINEEKAWLKTQIEYQRRIIGEFDAQCIANESSDREYGFPYSALHQMRLINHLLFQ